jgi:hypothetical protein
MSATISDCGKFRYRLGRRWAEGGLTLAYVMLNPSTADAEQDDATIRRCIGFAKAHDFNALEVVNLYAYRATDPVDLRKAGYPVGPENDCHIIQALAECHAVCVAWGANVAGLERPQIVLPMIRQVMTTVFCLGITRSGYPAHPLMLPSSRRLQPFAPGEIETAMEAARNKEQGK